MSNSTGSATDGVSFGGLLFLVFLTLKLTEVITWSWWWVTAPLWIPAVLVAFILVSVGSFLLLVMLVARKKRKASDAFFKRTAQRRRNKK